MTHTPGPWSVSEYGIDGPDGASILRAVDGHVYDEYDSDSATIDFSNEADARLIEAAPDMFQTLECARMAVAKADIGAMGWGAEPHETLGQNVLSMRDELLNLIDAAIAKARAQ